MGRGSVSAPPSDLGLDVETGPAARTRGTSRGGVIQPPAGVCGDSHDVLDADSEPTAEIDAWLYREAHSWLEFVCLALDHVRGLVGGQAYAVSGAVDEVVAVAGVRDHCARCAVDVLAGDAGAYRLECGLLGAADDLENVPFLVSWLADVDGAGGIRSVAVLDAAEVEHHHVAGLDGALADLMVRIGAVGAGADDGEIDL